MIKKAQIFWSSKHQASISQSSCEFEYYALSKAGKEKMWLQLIIQEFGYISAALTVIYANNQGWVLLDYRELQ